MEPYKPYGRNTCGQNMNQCGSGSGGACCGSTNNVRSSFPSCNSGHSHVQSARSNRDCRDDNPHLGKMPLGMAYVPMQKWGELYDPKTALCQGTAFPDMNLIFCGSRGKM